MGNGSPQSGAIALIGAMITPALLILASASLVASALVRMGRVVDRVRALTLTAGERDLKKHSLTPELLHKWFDRHALRAQYAELSITLLYLAIVTFIATCLSITLDRAVGNNLDWLPISLAIFGTLLLFVGGAFMVAESRLSGTQVKEEIELARAILEE